MKSLPEKFPIRYAIVVDSHTIDDEEQDAFELAKNSSLLRQLMAYLISHPLNRQEDLTLGYQSISFSDSSSKLGIIPQLYPDKDWLTETKKKLEEFLNPYPIALYRFIQTSGRAYDLTLYSYAGMCDVPIFTRILNHNDKKTFEDYNLKRLNFNCDDKVFNDLSQKYKVIMRGYDRWTQYSPFKREKEVFYMELPYTKLWKNLDSGICLGTVSGLPWKNKYENERNEGGVETGEKIRVAVSFGIEPLLLEEMYALYKISSFCNCCGKPLPFDYKGKYCPNISENIDCNRKRARLRKKK
jgi:hypothetical protein